MSALAMTMNKSLFDPNTQRDNHSRRMDDQPQPAIPIAVRRFAISLLALLATLLLGRLALHRFDAPVRELLVRGALRNVQADAVRAAAAPLIEARLFELDLNALRSAVEELPWVAHARVDRQWPARLAVSITEREVFARWGSNEALSTEAVVFTPGDVALPDTLPRLAAPAGREQEVMSVYSQLAERLADTPFVPITLVQDARGEWTGSTASGISLRFGRHNPLEQVERLKASVAPALASRLTQVRSVDLRYANGFAVGWSNGSERNSGTESTLESLDSATANAAAAPGATP